MPTKPVGRRKSNIGLSLVNEELEAIRLVAFQKGVSLGQFIRECFLLGLEKKDPALAQRVQAIREKHAKEVAEDRFRRSQQRQKAVLPEKVVAFPPSAAETKSWVVQEPGSHPDRGVEPDEKAQKAKPVQSPTQSNPPSPKRGKKKPPKPPSPA